jgi:hypothetical protein
MFGAFFVANLKVRQIKDTLKQTILGNSYNLNRLENANTSKRQQYINNGF